MSNTQTQAKLKGHLKVDTKDLILVSHELNAPIPSQVKDKQESHNLNLTSKNSARVNDMSRGFDRKVYSEYKEVTALRFEFDSWINKHCLPMSIGSDKIISVHYIDDLKNKVIEINSRLIDVRDRIIEKLPEWEENAKIIGSYVAGKFPSPSYFAGYKLGYRLNKFSSEFDFSDEVEAIKENTISRLKESVNLAFTSINAFLSDDKKSFKNASIDQLKETVDLLKISNFVESEQFENIVSKIEAFTNQIDCEEIRKNQKIVKGDKTSYEVKKALQEKNEKAIEPLQDLFAEIEGL